MKWWSLPIVSVVCACGGREVSSRPASTLGSGGAKTSAAGAGGNGSLGGTGGAVDACSPANAHGGAPSSIGCFAGTDEGWVQVPCLCDLWLKNTTHDALVVNLTLSFAGTPPASTDAPAPELDLHDPDSAFYAVWSEQAAAGAPITVVRTDDITAVRSFAANVVLGPVTFPACGFVTGTAFMNGAGGALGMHADLLDTTGNVALTSDGSCFVPPHL